MSQIARLCPSMSFCLFALCDLLLALRQMLDNVGRYGFNSDGFKVVYDRLKARNKRIYGECIILCFESVMLAALYCSRSHETCCFLIGV